MLASSEALVSYVLTEVPKDGARYFRKSSDWEDSGPRFGEPSFASGDGHGAGGIRSVHNQQ